MRIERGSARIVYSIDSHHHWNGSANGCVDTWWVVWGGSLQPYLDRFMHRIVHELTFREYNTAKNKWDEMSTSRGVTCEIKANGKPIYQFTTSELEYAMAKAQYMLINLSEHPYNFYDSKSENGRKIWWYGLPATVRTKQDGWEIIVIPDYSTGVDKKTWWTEYKNRKSKLSHIKSEDDFDHDDEDDFTEAAQGDYINWGDAFSDAHINWFRK